MITKPYVLLRKEGRSIMVSCDWKFDYELDNFKWIYDVSKSFSNDEKYWRENYSINTLIAQSFRYLIISRTAIAKVYPNPIDNYNKIKEMLLSYYKFKNNNLSKRKCYQLILHDMDLVFQNNARKCGVLNWTTFAQKINELKKIYNFNVPFKERTLMEWDKKYPKFYIGKNPNSFLKFAAEFDSFYTPFIYIDVYDFFYSYNDLSFKEREKMIEKRTVNHLDMTYDMTYTLLKGENHPKINNKKKRGVRA